MRNPGWRSRHARGSPGGRDGARRPGNFGNFGIDLINGVKVENPDRWPAEVQAGLVEKIRHAVELDLAYADGRLPHGALGLNADLFREYVGSVADRRVERIGLPRQYRARNPCTIG